MKRRVGARPVQFGTPPNPVMTELQVVDPTLSATPRPRYPRLVDALDDLVRDLAFDDVMRPVPQPEMSP